MSLARLQSRLALTAALLAGSLVLAAPAGADIGETIILRCTHGQSLAGFSQSAYDRALKQLSADSEEYSNCRSLIRQAQLAAAGGRGVSGAGAGGETVVPVTATASEQTAVRRAASGAPGPPLRLGGQLVRPGVIHADVASALSSLPSSLLAVLAFLAVCLLLLAGVVARDRIRGRRAD